MELQSGTSNWDAYENEKKTKHLKSQIKAIPKTNFLSHYGFSYVNLCQDFVSLSYNFP